MTDPEIEAMSVIADALAGLDEEPRKRVLRWAGDRYDVPVGVQTRRAAGGAGTRGGGADADQSNGDDTLAAPLDFEHVAELFAAADPKTNEDKALVAGYWLQEIQGQSKGWQAAGLQTELKHLGHAIPNITDALTSNIRQKPQRVIQLQKSGSTRQARKTYKLTHAGVLHVRGMLNRGS